MKLAKPIAYLKDQGGYYALEELAQRTNMPLADVRSAISAAAKARIIESREHHGVWQVRYVG
jgi:hypothetical protein